MMLRHDGFKVLTNIDFTAFIPIRRYACVYHSRSS